MESLAGGEAPLKTSVLSNLATAISEILDSYQRAMASINRVMGLLDIPVAIAPQQPTPTAAIGAG
ncbi:MAG: hypothetical protein K6T90_18930 [Leptolyngbyaceae cyanobacterium HOT.MB2.61]|nr:hypothetical protein [Leptolyngbyaceae cyanobacterium HOT.MB2.61]